MRKLVLSFLSIVPCLAIAQPLSLDQGFGNNGAAVCAETGRSREAFDLVRQPDGKLLAAGIDYARDGNLYYESFLTRFLPNGSLDNTFGQNGSVRLVTGNKSIISAVQVQVDGKIVVAGNETIIIEGGNPPSATILSRPFIARFTSQGVLDNSFGNAGINRLEILNAYLDKELSALVLLPDGRIISGGTAFMNAFDPAKMMLLCLKADGTYDNSFGTSGLAFYGMEAGKNAVLWDMILQQDGKLLFCGYSGDASLIIPPDMRFALGRANTDGTPDLSFGTQGSVVTTVSAGPGASDLAAKVRQQADGKICVAGSAGNQLALARYNLDGTLDPTFAQNGKLKLEGHPVATGLGIYEGKLYTCGAITRDNGELDLSISAINSNGTEDTTIGVSGNYSVHIYNRNYTHSMLIQPDGKLVTGGGFSSDDNDQGILLARFGRGGTTGLPSVKNQEAAFHIFPNPANDYLTITRNTTASQDGTVRIISAAGQTVYTGTCKGQTTTIPVAHLAAGVYALRFQAGTAVQTLLFVKK